MSEIDYAAALAELGFAPEFIARATATQAREARAGTYAGFRTLVAQMQIGGAHIPLRETQRDFVIHRVEAQENTRLPLSSTDLLDQKIANTRRLLAELAHLDAPQHDVRESLATAYGVELREVATLSERAVSSAKSTGKMLVQFISPGWGSSGYYSPQVLQEAASNRVIPAGTHMYADHPTDEQRRSRPERSIRDLMAVTTSDAKVAPNGALVGEVRVVAPYQGLLADLRENIGVSILGDATDVYEGEAEGRRGRIIEGLAKVHSVDFVTRAGRGGAILSLLEAAGL
jgi:hypothetical protein